MIYAELKYAEHYSDIHEKLVNHLLIHFDRLEQGLQGDSWIWIYSEDEKVVIDTFYSMRHQIKSSSKTTGLVQQVITVLKQQFDLIVYPKPLFEPDE